MNILTITKLKYFILLIRVISCLIISVAFSNANATDLGQLGKSYLIAEPDLIETIKLMINEKKENGELDKLHQKMTKNAKGYVRRPPGRALPKAQKYRAFAVDPTYTLPKDIKDAEGRVLYKAGFTYNPLTIKPMTKTLCFIDGDDPDQVLWLENYCGNSYAFKRILVNGDYNEITKNTQSRVYFDQRGFLVSHFRIEAVPAVVRQSGGLLYVEEFKL